MSIYLVDENFRPHKPFARIPKDFKSYFVFSDSTLIFVKPYGPSFTLSNSTDFNHSEMLQWCSDNNIHFYIADCDLDDSSYHVAAKPANEELLTEFKLRFGDFIKQPVYVETDFTL